MITYLQLTAAHMVANALGLVWGRIDLKEIWEAVCGIPDGRGILHAIRVTACYGTACDNSYAERGLEAIAYGAAVKQAVTRACEFAVREDEEMEEGRYKEIIVSEPTGPDMDDKGNIVHRTAHGRFVSSVSPAGEIKIFLCRPWGWVIKVTCLQDRVSVVLSGRRYEKKHAEILKELLHKMNILLEADQEEMLQRNIRKGLGPEEMSPNGWRRVPRSEFGS